MKFQRQAKIVELIEKNEIETQEELSKCLRNIGFDTTQATVSRDIKELRLIKMLSTSGKYRYSTSARDSEGNFSKRLRNIFKESVMDINYSQIMVVVKTLPGLGSAAAMAIDAMKFSNVVGTLAGDDTVFVVMTDIQASEEFCLKAKKLLS